MAENRLGLAEKRFAEIIWEHEPITTQELVAICKEVLEWKRTTTYTVLKRLCERGLFEMKDSVVVSLVSKEEFLAAKSEAFVRENFQGSLPAFLNAFTRQQKLSAAEMAEIRAMLDSYAKEE